MSLISVESHANSEKLTQEVNFFDQKPRLLAVSLIILFLLAGMIRLYRIEAPGLLIDREYLSAILARDFYFEHADSVEGWQKEIAHVTRQNQPVLEPPVTEFLVSLIYRVVGSEQLWLARLLTSSFWLVGGIFLYKTAKMVMSTEAAIAAIAYYLFIPLSILLSRSFQPDSLMMMLFLISLFSILRYYEESSDFRLLVAASISGVTLLYRPLVLFTLLGVFIVLAIYQKNSWRGVIDKRFVIFIIVSLLPTVLYYGYGIFFAGFLRWKMETSFRPHLLLHRVYWEGWVQLAVNAVGYLPLIAAFLGLPMLRPGLSRIIVVGLGVGYFIYGLVFTMHIHTHGYYHAQLIPIVAFAFSPIVNLVVNHLKRSSIELFWSLPVIGALLLGLFFNFQEVRYGLNFEVLNSAETAREIGEIVNHSSKVVYIAPYYGFPLQYYGELAGAYWPRPITTSPLYRRAGERELSIEERFQAFGFSPEYFVITNFKEYERDHHSDLKTYLEENCSLLADNNQYLIYHLCKQKFDGF